MTSTKIGKALLWGTVGAAAISLASAALRALGLPIHIELLLGTLTGLAPGVPAFFLGLVFHLALGAIFGVIYGALFEHVWDHGGASTGMILSFLHASLIGMFVGLTPQFHPLVPELIAAPGAYFSSLGAIGVISFYALHLVYGVIVGAGYGHVAAERAWAPTGRL